MVVTTGEGLASQPPPLLLLEQGSGSPDTLLLPFPEPVDLLPSPLPERGSKMAEEGGHAPTPNTQVPRHRSSLPRTAAHRFSHTSHECPLSPPAQPLSQSWWSNWGQWAKYRLDPKGSHPDNYTACPGHPQSAPVQEGTLRKAGSRLGGESQGCMEHKAHHLYKEKVKKVTRLRHRAGTAGAGGCWGVQARGGQPGPRRWQWEEKARKRGHGGGKLAEHSINARADLAESKRDPGCPTCSERGWGRGGLGAQREWSPRRQQAGLGLNAAQKSWVGISTKEETEARVEKRKWRPRSPGRGTPSAPGEEGGTCRALGTTAWEQGWRRPRASGACFPGVGGAQMGVGQAVWEVMLCGEQAENTLHSRPRAREESRVQRSQRGRQLRKVRCCVETGRSSRQVASPLRQVI